MGVDFYLVPRVAVGGDPAIARDWLDQQERRFAEIPNACDPIAGIRVRKLAELLLKMKPDFEESKLQYEKIAAYENISEDEARRKFRMVEINGPRIQFTIYDQYIFVGVYSKVDAVELDAIFAALAAEGDFVLFDPQSDEVIDLSECA